MNTNQRMRRLPWLAIAILTALAATFAMASVAAAGSGETVTVEESGSRGGDVTKAEAQQYCEGPADADESQIEYAPEPRGETSGSIERAPEPGFCEQPADQDLGEVTARD